MSVKKDYIKFLIGFSLLTTCLINSIRVVYMLSYGLSEGNIICLKGIFSIIVSLAEIPTGVVADRVSKKLSLQIGCVLFALHALVYAVFPSFEGFLVTQILLAFSSAFISGADDGYLDDYIHKYTHDTYIDIAGKIEYYSSFFHAALYLISGYLFTFNAKSNFIFTFLLGLISFSAICLLPEIKNQNNDSSSNEPEKVKYIKDTMDVIKYVFKKKIVFHVTLLSGVIVSILIFNFELYQMVLSNLNFSTKFYGYLYASFMILGGIGAKISKKILLTYGEKRLFIISLVFVAISYLLFGLSNNIVLILLAIVIQQVVFGSIGLVVKNILMNSLFSQNTKSTLISVYSLLVALFKGVLVLVLGIILSIMGIRYTYVIMTFIMIVCILYARIAIKNE